MTVLTRLTGEMSDTGFHYFPVQSPLYNLSVYQSAFSESHVRYYTYTASYIYFYCILKENILI